MSTKQDKLTFNDRECDYDYYGDTRNNPKHNEEKPYAKCSYNYKASKKISESKMKKEIQSEKNKAINNQEELEKKEHEEKEKNKIDKRENKRKLKKISEENINYGNNYEKIEQKVKKVKRPRKDRIRY